MELGRVKHRVAVFEQQASAGEARDRSGLTEQVDVLCRKLEKEAEARVTLGEYSVTRLQSLTNAQKDEQRAKVDEMELRCAMLENDLFKIHAEFAKNFRKMNELELTRTALILLMNGLLHPTASSDFITAFLQLEKVQLEKMMAVVVIFLEKEKLGTVSLYDKILSTQSSVSSPASKKFI